VFRLGLRGVRFNLGRYVATLVAIVTGVAFFAASGFLGARVVSALEGDIDRQFGAVDAAVIADARGDDDAAGDLRIGAAAYARLAALPQTAGIGGELAAGVSFLGADGRVFASRATGRLWIADDALNPVDVAAGAAPAAAGEIAVDRGLAAEHRLAVGDAVTVLTAAGKRAATITGLTRFGDSDGQDLNGTVSIPAAAAFEWLNRGREEYSSVLLRARGSAADLVAAVEPVVPAGFRVQSGEDLRAERRADAAGFGRFLTLALQAFSSLALVVGGFVIYNTFNVIVAQRTRELAVLAAIGATPKQLSRALRSEALVIGLVGSVLGVASGFGLTFGLMAVLSQLGIDLPGAGIRVAPGTVVVSMLFGTLITLVSASLPARRAGRAEPLEALRQADAGVVTVGKARTVLASVLAGAGVVAMLVGPSAAVVGAGALVLFLGVVGLGPVLAVGGGRVLRPVLRVFGLEGALAADNTARNPQRTATTANALLIGVFLVTFVTVAGTSAKDFILDEINALSTADFTITSDGGVIDAPLVADLQAVDGVVRVTPFRRETVALTVDGTTRGSTSLSAGDLASLREAAGLDLVAGSYEDLGPGTVVLLQTQLTDGGGVGSTAVVTDAAGRSASLRVVGVVGVSLDAMATGAVVTDATLDDLVGATPPTVAFVTTEPGAQTKAGEAIKAVTDLRPDLSLQAGNFVGRLIGAIFDFLIAAVNGLLLMSVVIALIGIVNTLTLSILERRRELGLLRVVGMVDRRVRRMVRIESVVIATLGTVCGLLLGTFCGFALVTAIGRLSGAGISVSLPVGLLGGILGLGVAMGALASLIPAYRSTRLAVLDALRTT